MRLLLLILASVGIAPAQTTWVVDALNRPGTNFTDIQPAVDAAASGDVILVRGAGLPPTGARYTAPIIDGKGVSLIGEGATTTWLSGILEVRNLAGDQRVVLRGVHWGWPAALTFSGMGMVLSNNAGPIVFERVVCNGAPTSPSPNVTDCRLVVFSHCDVTVRFLGYITTRSNVMLDDSRFFFAPSDIGGGPLFNLVNSRLWLSNSSVEGCSASVPGHASGPALGGGFSDVWLGAGSRLVGGLNSHGRTAINDGGTFCVRIDPLAQLVGSYVYLPQALIQPVTTLRTDVTGGTLTVHHRCTPSAITLLGAGPLLAAPWPSSEGLLCIDPALAFPWFTAVPTSGQLQWSFSLPPGLPQGLFLGLQGVELRPNATLGVTNLAAFLHW
jgi:hypothetical protein